MNTAFHQIQTAKETKGLRTDTNSHEIPRKVLFLSTFNFEDRHTANQESWINKLKDYCTFLTGEKFALQFKEKLPTEFSAIVNPGNDGTRLILGFIKSQVDHKLLENDKEIKPTFYVSMKLADSRSEISRYILAKRKPKDLTSEHVQKDRIVNASRYRACMMPYVELPEIFVTEKSNERVTKKITNGPSEKQPVSAINLGKLFEFVIDLSMGKRFDSCEKEFADLLFGTCNFLSDHLKWHGDISHSTQQTKNLKGINLGSQGNAIEMLARSSDSVFIIGDPGGGKTFTARELCNVLARDGKTITYFPCSRSIDGKSLKFSILKFLSTILSSSNKLAEQHLDNSEVIVLDGLDEINETGPKIISEIQDLAASRLMELRIKGGSRKQFSHIPDTLAKKVSLKRSKSGWLVKCESPLFWDERLLLSKILCEEDAVEEKVANQLQFGPRIIATCRESLNLDLGSGFRTLKLQPFDESQLNQFIEGHCKIAKKSPSVLLKFLKSNPYVGEVCRNPLTAAIMVSIFLRGRELPKSRTELYARRFSMLLSDWDYGRGVNRKTSTQEIEKERIALYLAYYMHCRNKSEIPFTEAEDACIKEFKTAFSKQATKSMIRELVTHHGILTEISGMLNFCHLSHQEYCCAKYLNVNQKQNTLIEHFGNPWWRNVTKFFVGIMGNADTFLVKAQKRGHLIHDKKFVRELANEGYCGIEFVKVLDEFLTE